MRGHSVRYVAMGLITGLLCLPAYANRKHGDVEKIGNRHVSGKIFRVLPNMVSLDKEVALGSQIAGEFEQTARLIEDPVVSEYVDRIGQYIVKHSDAKIPFTIKVVDTDEVNAFAFPGGYFYVNKGLILAADNEAELAGVMAHEIAHVAARHATQRMSKGQYLQIAAIPASFFGGPLAQMAIQNGIGLGLNLELMGVTRESEREADQLGLQYLWNSGYDPNAFVSFMEKLQAEEKIQPGKLASWFRTHPSAEDRIIASLDEERYLPEKDEYMINTSEFDRVKARLKSIDNAERAETTTSTLGQKRPALKRRTGDDTPDPNDTGSSGGGPDDNAPKKSRPTLKHPSDSPDPQPKD